MKSGFTPVLQVYLAIAHQMACAAKLSVQQAMSNNVDEPVVPKT